MYLYIQYQREKKTLGKKVFGGRHVVVEDCAVETSYCHSRYLGPLDLLRLLVNKIPYYSPSPCCSSVLDYLKRADLPREKNHISPVCCF
jgi:hypothetical protein